jgi:hypothetical protein
MFSSWRSYRNGTANLLNSLDFPSRGNIWKSVIDYRLLQMIIISSYFYDDRVDLPSTYGIRQQAVSVISSRDLL